MAPKIYTIAIFSCTLWLEKDGNRERVLSDLIGGCLNNECGGKLHLVVCVGNIENGRYLAKNPSALWHDSEFPLQTGIRCTNCKGEVGVPASVAGALSTATGKFLEELKKIRQCASDRRN